MKNPKFLVCQFRPDDRGPYCEQPIGQMPHFGRVFLDRLNQVPAEIGTKYVCRHVDYAGKSHFVRIEKAARDILTEFLPALTTTTWKRGPHLTSDIEAECAIAGYGVVNASWYQSTGRYVHKFVTVKFTWEGEPVTLTLEPHEAPAALAAIEKRVRACVGPIAALGAAIARNRDARTSSGW